MGWRQWKARHRYDCKWKQSTARSILERGVMRESNPMHSLAQIAIGVCANPIPAAIESLGAKEPRSELEPGLDSYLE